MLYAAIHEREACGSHLVFKIMRRPLPLEEGSPVHLQHAQKGRRLWLGDEISRREGEAMLDRVGPQYGIKFSWNGMCSSAMDSLRLVLWAQTLGKSEEFMAALGWRHHGEDQQLANHQVLLDAAEEAGLNRHEAQKVLDSQRFRKELAESSSTWMRKTMTPAGRGVYMSGIPVLIFRSGWMEEKLQGSVPQSEIEQVLLKLEAQYNR